MLQLEGSCGVARRGGVGPGPGAGAGPGLGHEGSWLLGSRVGGWWLTCTLMGGMRRFVQLPPPPTDYGEGGTGRQLTAVRAAVRPFWEPK